MIRIYTDGACSGPRPAGGVLPSTGTGGWAWILVRDGQPVCGDLGRIENVTSQQMELVAAGKALAWAPTWLDVTIVSDSAYLVNCFNDRWYVKWRETNWKNGNVKNQPYWERLLELVESRQGPTSWLHVKGHNGDQWNEVCDRLAVYARTTTNQPR